MESVTCTLLQVSIMLNMCRWEEPGLLKRLGQQQAWCAEVLAGTPPLECSTRPLSLFLLLYTLCYRWHYGYADVPGRHPCSILNSSHSITVNIPSAYTHFRAVSIPFHRDPANVFLVSILTAECLGPISFSSSVTEISSTFHLASKSRIPCPLLTLIYPSHCC